MKRVIALVLILTLIVSLSSNAATKQEEKTSVFVSGIEFLVEIEDFTVTIETADTSDEAELFIGKEGDGYIKGTKDLKKGEKYEISIDELSSDKFEFEIKKNGEKVKKYESVKTFRKDNYDPQFAIAGTVILGAALLEVLALLGLVLIIAGITYVAVSEITEELERQKKYYFKAYKQFNVIFVASTLLSVGEAASRIQNGNNCYTFVSALAYAGVAASGLGAVYHTYHGAPLYIGDDYKHYHPANFNGAHMWYGLPK